MRLLLATFKHETNTFSPVPTPLGRFFKGADAPLTGEDALTARRGSGSCIGGFIDVAEKAGAELVVAVVADASPSGPVERNAYDRIVSLIVDAARDQVFDGILLDLHGAMVTEDYEDGEGELLRRLRVVQPDVPIGVTFDMHANVYGEMIDRITVLTGYHTYPHVDMLQTGKRAAALLLSTIRGEIKPVLAWGNRPMLPHIMRQGTHAEPNRSLQAECIALEREGNVLAASLFTGFPHADIYNAGLSAVICTNANAELAEQTCQSLLEHAWEQRKAFLYEGTSLGDAVVNAQKASGAPVVLLDHCDNVASGGTMDTTLVLREVIERKLDNAVFYAIYDSTAVEEAIAAGVGNELTVSLGGKSRLPATGETNHPISVHARVRTISEGRVALRGPMNAGVSVSTGRTVVLEVGGLLIVVISAHNEPSDLNYFHALGIDPTKKRYLILKSRVHWRAGFGNMAAAVVECDSIGVTTSDYSKRTFEKVRRPVFPLDEI